MAQDELSKRIDDVHRRLDDLRADVLQLRQEMASGFAQSRQEMTQLRQEMTQLRQEMKEGDAALRKETDRRFGQLFWQMNIWFAILALLMTAYRFLR